jgi:hypothetical protein
MLSWWELLSWYPCHACGCDYKGLETAWQVVLGNIMHGRGGGHTYSMHPVVTCCAGNLA